MEIEIDDHAIRLLALRQPIVVDLRFITAALKMNNDLERMGDLAVHIAEQALALMKSPPVKSGIDMARWSSTWSGRPWIPSSPRARRQRGAFWPSTMEFAIYGSLFQKLINFVQRELGHIP